MSSFSRGTLALLLSLACCRALGAQVRTPAVTDTVRVQRPLPTLTRPPIQVVDSVVVPAVVGQSVILAVRRLTAAGLRPVTVDSAPVTAPRPGIVVSQSPRAGSRVARGSPGVVSVGVPAPTPPPQELVPSLLGMTMPQAEREMVERKLRLAGLDSVRQVGGSGRVAAQRPAAGSPMPRDRAISLVLSVPALVDPVTPPGGTTGPPPEPDPTPLGPVDPPPVPTGPVEPEPAPAPPADAGPAPPSPAPPGPTPVDQQPGEPPAPPPTANPAAPAGSAPPAAADPAAAARVDTVPVPVDPTRRAVPWILFGLLAALLVAAALAARRGLEARRERTALRLALQAGPPAVRIAPKRHPDRQELRLPGPLFSGPAVRILPRRDPGTARLVLRPSPTTREARP